MQIPSFLQKFGRDIVYLSVIGGLAGWICMNGKREEAWNILTYEGINTYEDLGRRYNQIAQREIEKVYYSYPNEYNKIYWDRIKLADAETQAFKNNVQQILEESNTSGPKNRFISKSSLNILKSSTRKLCDSLIHYVEQEPYCAAKLKSLLAQDSTTAFWEVAEKLPPHQFKIILKILELKADAAFTESLNRLGSRVQSDDSFDQFYPVSISDRPVIMTGETYRAHIFLARVPRSTANLTINVNNKVTPIINGFADFSKRYFTPGKKKYKVSIEEKNPFTGKIVSTYSREYNLMVIDSCQ